jgi:hypothetical protein
VGCENPCKKDYDDVVNALLALRTLNIEYRNTWWDKGQRKHPGRLAVAGLLSEFDFCDERQVSQRPGEPAPRRSYVRISDMVFESLKAGYFNGVDLGYMNLLKRSPLSVRLYSYLAKKDNARTIYSENLQGLAMKLNLKRKSPSAIYKCLAPALEQLAEATPTGQKNEARRFLESWTIPKDRAHLTVKFFKTQ